MVTTLSKHGECLALVIDRPILDLLKIDEQTPLEITTDGQTLIVTPVGDPARADRFAAALKAGNDQYANAMKRLAE